MQFDTSFGILSWSFKRVQYHYSRFIGRLIEVPNSLGVEAECLSLNLFSEAVMD